jgi:hypothetical protein
MVNDSSGFMGMREGIGIWSEILIAYTNSWNTLQSIVASPMLKISVVI